MRRQQQYGRDEKNARSKETRLIIVVGLLAVAVIALVVTLTLQVAVFGKHEYKEMCQSEECIRTGKAMHIHCDSGKICILREAGEFKGKCRLHSVSPALTSMPRVAMLIFFCCFGEDRYVHFRSIMVMQIYIIERITIVYS